jgi:predicted nuclease of predicted toxin-antitoxin system
VFYVRSARAAGDGLFGVTCGKASFPSTRPDEEIWAAAQKESRFLITQDLDFSDERKFSPGSHCGLLLLRLGCFVVVTAREIRVAKPQSDGTA